MEEEIVQRSPSSLLSTPSLCCYDLDDHELHATRPWKSPCFLPSANGTKLRLRHFFLSLFFMFYFALFYFCQVPPAINTLVFVSCCVALGLALLNGCRDSRFIFRKDESVRWFIGEETEGGLNSGSTLKSTTTVAGGDGVVVYKNGDAYEGEFEKGRCNGSGVYSFFGKGRYEGDWVDGRYDGHGIERWALGSQYRGQFRQGLRHGVGVYRFYNGDGYAGEWLNGQSHGCGAQSCSDGSCYVGDFRHGVKHGFGRYRFRNGDGYTGEYFADMIHGFGVYSFANGHCYEGSWHEGRRQGFGVYRFKNGDMRSGAWDCGILKNFLSISDPSVQRTIEAARKAAEKAKLQSLAEEEVNKVVSTANTAAIAARTAAFKAVQIRMQM